MKVIPCPSPNFNARKLPISMLVLHYTGMESGQAAIERLCDPAAQVSAHYVVEEDGTILNLVAEDQRAWHAGVSAWNGVRDVNSASIGIEIVNGGHDFGLPDFPAVQIEAVIALCQDILSRHAIHPLDVVGHSDIAPSRKTDPGEKFPWARLAAQGIGLFPEGGASEDILEEAALAQRLSTIGYDVSAAGAFSDLICAVQRRYTPADLSGQAGPHLCAMIGALSAQR
ncbi:N-acetylmuramoyl-L-alanine amidase [Woodsholea maritima]|uniref:N-acetylmuramoyl-L-alanine amidase n=1 Tax=Woodsholea maritima TaxID=240237 RepID=UPI00037C59BE|nr:N-acetylmuramoyl-L-alanine amidase [Woodsholea maritima]